MVIDVNTLKTRFESADKPSSADFIDLIDTLGSYSTSVNGALLKASNLSDLASVATARTNLGMGSLALLSAINNGNWSGAALAIGNGGTGQTTPAAARAAFGLQYTVGNIVAISDAPASGQNGGTFTSGAWQKRNLAAGTLIQTNTIATTSNGEITLPAGNYRVWAKATGYRVDSHCCRLYNVTDSQIIIFGFPARAPATLDIPTDSWLWCRFNLPATKTLRLEHMCQTTRATDGMGSPTGFPTGVLTGLEYYAFLLFEQEVS